MNSMKALTSSVDQASDCIVLSHSQGLDHFCIQAFLIFLCLLDFVEGHTLLVCDVSKEEDPLGVGALTNSTFQAWVWGPCVEGTAHVI